MQCFGRNRDFSRCKNSTKFLVCKKHRSQLIIFLLFTLPGIFLTYNGIYHIFKSDDEKYLPAREAVISAIFESYKSLNNAAELIIDPNRISTTVRITAYQKFKLSKLMLEPIEYDLNKVENIVKRNNVALEPKTFSLVSSYIDNARLLQKKLKFYAQLHDPELNRWDFVSRGPFEELLKIENTIKELKKLYPKVIFPDKIKSYKELEKIWKNVEKNNDRILFNVDEYVWKKNRLPMVFDTGDLVKLGGKLGYQVYVYDLNE